MRHQNAIVGPRRVLLCDLCGESPWECLLYQIGLGSRALTVIPRLISCLEK